MDRFYVFLRKGWFETIGLLKVRCRIYNSRWHVDVDDDVDVDVDVQLLMASSVKRPGKAAKMARPHQEEYMNP